MGKRRRGGGGKIYKGKYYTAKQVPFFTKRIGKRGTKVAHRKKRRKKRKCHNCG